MPDKFSVFQPRIELFQFLDGCSTAFVVNFMWPGIPSKIAELKVRFSMSRVVSFIGLLLRVYTAHFLTTFLKNSRAPFFFGTEVKKEGPKIFWRVADLIYLSLVANATLNRCAIIRTYKPIELFFVITFVLFAAIFNFI